MIEAKHLFKSFGREKVLRGLSLRLRPGECAGLIGASGAGKTVLARCLVGLETPDAGTIRIGDWEFDATVPRFNQNWTLARRKVALVFQSRVLPAYRSVLDLITEGPRFALGMKKDAAIDFSMPWIERLALAEHLNKYPAQISGGQLTRVCLARAAVMKPDYLICDEITANLDPALAGEVLDSLSQFVDAGLGVLLISHQLEFLRRHASIVHFVSSGKIVVSGKPNVLFSEPPQEELAHFLRDLDLAR